MKKIVILFLFLSIVLKLNAQTYTKLTDSALNLMSDAKDTVDYRKSLNLYKKAFILFPKEVSDQSLYKASVLASELKDNNDAIEYLNHLLALNNDERTTWDYLTFEYPQNEYINLFNDGRWPIVLAKAQKMKATFFKKLHDRQEEFQASPLNQGTYFKAKNGKQAYQEIKSFNAYQAKNDIGYSIEFKVTDSIITSYYVSLPSRYNPKKSYPVLFFLHGAVSGNSLSSFQNASWVMDGWNRYYTKYAAVNEVIMVYPKGSKKFNWMKPDDGFFMVPAMLREIKKSINVDDDKVFITGHSNGATGSFSYLMKQQSPFAGFYGFNTQPRVRTGGTFVRNILSRSFFNVSTDEDYYFPPDANDSLNVIMKKMGADYQDHRYKGWPHWFPQFDESEPAYKLLFKDLKSRSRNPFQKSIYWECDDVKYGKTDWIQITALDTANKQADWHKRINFDIYKVVDYDQSKDTVITTDTLFKAFNFPRKSSAVRATFSNNEFHIETSRVKSLTIFLSPEMIDVGKPVSVFINGIKRIEKMAVYDKKFILDNFNKTYDRKAVWIDQIKLLISN